MCAVGSSANWYVVILVIGACFEHSAWEHVSSHFKLTLILVESMPNILHLGIGTSDVESMQKLGS